MRINIFSEFALAIFLRIAVFFLLLSPVRAWAGSTMLTEVIPRNRTVSGEVVISEDLFIPEGVTLTFLPGTTVTIIPREGTRTDSKFLTTLTEISVRGTLSVPEGPVVFRPEGEMFRGSWAGIIMPASSSRVILHGVRIAGARYGLLAIGGEADIRDSGFSHNEIGIAVTPDAVVTEASNTFDSNGTGTAAWFSKSPLKGMKDRFSGNDDDTLALTAPGGEILHRTMKPVIIPAPPGRREYLGQEAITEDTVWSGTVVIDGQVAVMPDVTLTIRAGTRVLFRFRDTDQDGIGESWIIAQGRVRVLGKEDAWVLFDAEDEKAGPGAWGSFSIIASDAPDNLVRYALFRHGHRSFHVHFARASLEHVAFEDNLRGVQFQESEGLSINWGLFTGNQSAMRFRDSTVDLSNIVVRDNTSGINFLRARVRARNLLVEGNTLESFLARESDTDLSGSVFTRNRQGPRFKGEGEQVRMWDVASVGNLTEGMSFKNVKADILDSDLSDNGLTGVSVTDAEVSIGSSRIAGNGRFAVDNNGSTRIDARHNDWGKPGPPSRESIYDGTDEEGIGMVLTDDPTSFTLAFPGRPLPAGTQSADTLITGDVAVPSGRTVKLGPGARVRFAPIQEGSLFDLYSDHPDFSSSELLIRGKIEATGGTDDPVTFSRAAPPEWTDIEPPPLWGGINLTGGEGGIFRNCVISGALTGIHAREAASVAIEQCILEDNEVGIRFSRTHVSITDNIFRHNEAGLRFHEFGGVVENNSFDSNETAVFVTKNPQGVILRNNIFRNSADYHVKLGEHVSDDIRISGGIFEVPKGKRPEDLIFDRKNEDYLGKVILEGVSVVSGR
ncbi:MAG TPA: right-handed parallel beta-helix repeat-containing protein [Proteobacteria bacterium]|nr:hypothetical protein BMS3Abin14_01733 [bacterium BMS3Abin14]HDL53692.1 right-handed parallel beta-helix repeat-containing protein [Pseudomonadota bacterium]